MTAQYRVVFRREALHHLEEIRDYISENGSPDDASRYTDAIIDHCEALALFPFSGASREDLRPGLRTAGFRKRVTIAYAVLDETVAILGVFYGGRDFESSWRQDPQEGK